MQVDFFDDPPTIGEIHQNQIFKFIQHFQKYAKATNKVSEEIIRDRLGWLPASLIQRNWSEGPGDDGWTNFQI